MLVKRILWVAAAALVLGALLVGRALTGRNDRFFTVTLVNRSRAVVFVGSCRDERCATVKRDELRAVPPSASDLETASSTAHQPTAVATKAGFVSCVDLFAAVAPQQPLAIVGGEGTLTVTGMRRC
jgi:hypothetical protein